MGLRESHLTVPEISMLLCKCNCGLIVSNVDDQYTGQAAGAGRRRSVAS